MTSWKFAIIGLCYGLRPVWHQAMAWTNVNTTNFCESLIKIQYFFVDESAFEIVVCKIMAILFRPRCVNWLHRNQCSWKSSDTSDISDGWAQMSDETFHKFESGKAHQTNVWWIIKVFRVHWGTDHHQMVYQLWTWSVVQCHNSHIKLFRWT